MVSRSNASIHLEIEWWIAVLPNHLNAVKAASSGTFAVSKTGVHDETRRMMAMARIPTAVPVRFLLGVTIVDDSLNVFLFFVWIRFSINFLFSLKWGRRTCALVNSGV